MKGLFGKKTTTTTTGQTKNNQLIKDDDVESPDNAETPSFNNTSSSTQQQDGVVKRGGVQSLFKKGLTAGKHKLLQSIGKADEIEHTQEYNEHNALYKDTLVHYKEMDKVGKRLVKSCEAVSSAEDAVGVQFKKFSEVLDVHSEVQTPELTSLKLAADSVGDAFCAIASLRESLQSNISVDYFNQVHECIEEANVCKQVKDNYRECLIEQNVEFNKLKNLKEKSNDLVKVKNQEVIHEKRVKMSEQLQDMAMKEFAYQEKLMEREYASSMRQLIDAYRNYFLSGVEILNVLERELLATTVTPSATPASTRSYNIRDMDRVMLNQNEQSKPTVSRAEILEKRRVFGVELSAVNKREHSYIPKIMTDLITYVETNGLDVEGIFRLAAGVPGLNKLKRLYDGGQVIDLDRLIQQKEIDIHVVACLLKLYLRELPTPVLTFDLYDSFLAVLDHEDDDSRAQALAGLLQQLPSHNILLLDRLLKMLILVASKSSVNLMHASNLSIVFGVNMLKSTDNNPLRVAKDNASVNKVCELLITYYSDRLSGTFKTLTNMAKQSRDLEIRQEVAEEKKNNHSEDFEPVRSTAVHVVAKEQLLPPPKPVSDSSATPPVKKMLPTPQTKAMPPIPQRRSTTQGTPTTVTQPQQQPQRQWNPFEEYSFDGNQEEASIYPNISSGNNAANHQRKPSTDTRKQDFSSHSQNPYAFAYDDDPF